MARVVVVGHGSARHQGARRATERLVAVLAASERFEDVRAAFWKEPPFLPDVLNAMPGNAMRGNAMRGNAMLGEDIWVVPHFAAEGVFTREVLPDLVAQAGAGGRVRITLALGDAPAIADLIRQRAEAAVARAGVAPDQVTVLLVGHGSRRPGGSGQSAHILATRLGRESAFAGVSACFLEEAPLAAAWDRLSDAPVVVVVPLLMGEGQHGGGDVPPLFDVTPQALSGDPAAVIGPIASRGRQVWYWRGVASDAQLAEVAASLIGGEASASGGEDG